MRRGARCVPEEEIFGTLRWIWFDGVRIGWV